MKDDEINCVGSCRYLFPCWLNCWPVLESLFSWAKKNTGMASKSGSLYVGYYLKGSLKCFKILAAYLRARLSHEQSFCSVAFVGLAGKRILWSCECHGLTRGTLTPWHYDVFQMNEFFFLPFQGVCVLISFANNNNNALWDNVYLAGDH